jgi:hypothetical protein
MVNTVWTTTMMMIQFKPVNTYPSTMHHWEKTLITFGSLFNHHNSRIFSEGSKPKLAKIYKRLDMQTEADSIGGGTSN